MHEKQIHGKSTCQFPGCRKEFLAIQSLKEHCRTQHQECYQCRYVECTSLFATDIDMMEHYTSGHDDHECSGNQFRCDSQCQYPGCRKPFSSEEEQRGHYTYCHLEASAFYCRFCDTDMAGNRK